MRRQLRHIALISASALLTMFALAAPVQAIFPMGMGFRIRPVVRITPAMNGMTGMAGSMTPTFNVQTGFTAVPSFRQNRMWWNRASMLQNASTSALSSGLGSSGTMGGYPMMSSYGGGGGGGGGYGQMSSVPTPQPAYDYSNANAGLAASAAEVSRMLSAAGLPNDHGTLTWPIGLQALFPATENAELTSKLNSSLQSAALQQTTGAIDPSLLRNATQDASRLRQMLVQREPYLQAPTYREADRFLTNLDKALKHLEWSTPAPAAK
jgi:hypothetical protein